MVTRCQEATEANESRTRKGPSGRRCANGDQTGLLKIATKTLKRKSDLGTSRGRDDMKSRR